MPRASIFRRSRSAWHSSSEGAIAGVHPCRGLIGVTHVTSRGNERREIFRDDEDRERFLTTVGRVVQTFGWRVHAYVLMGNHFHLLVETPEPTLSRGMRHLNGVYTQGFKRHHGRVGHLLQGRFKAILVERNRIFWNWPAMWCSIRSGPG